jgi:acetyl-CoA C-acetyltransferase
MCAPCRQQRHAAEARVHHMNLLGHDLVIMLAAPISTTGRALKRAGMQIGDIDLYEVNEAFAQMPRAWTQVLGPDLARLNVNDGAIASVHPHKGSGAKLMTTAVHALHRRGGQYRLQTMREGSGMANVTFIKRL